MLALIIAAVMIIFALLSARKLEREPKGLQLIAEIIVSTIYNFTTRTMGEKNKIPHPT